MLTNQTRQKVRNIDIFTDHVSSLAFVENLPFFAACSEDGKMCLVSTKTFEIVGEYDHFMKKAWSLQVLDRKVAVGYDEGCVVLQIGQETPLYSFNKGKLILCQSNAFKGTNLKALVTKNLKDFAVVKCEEKNIGSTDLFPKDLRHSPNGQYFFVTDGSEFAVHKSQTGKQTTFGNCDGILWSPMNQLCTLEGDYNIKFLSPMGEETNSLQLDFYVEKIFGGRFLGVVGIDFVVFYDFDTLRSVGKIDSQITDVQWPLKQDRFVVGTPEGFYLLDYFGSQPDNDSDMSDLEDEEEFDGYFDVVEEVAERYSTGVWVQGVFVYLKDSLKVCILGMGTPMVLVSLPFRSAIVGYLGTQNKLYLMSEKGELYTVSISKKLLVSVSKINNYSEEKKPELLKKTVNSFKSPNLKDYDVLAKMLLGNKQESLAFCIAKDPNLKFEIALKEKLLPEAVEICSELNETLKWKRLGDEAMLFGKFLIAKHAFLQASDLNSLIMMGSCLCDSQLLEFVARKAMKEQHYSAAFCSFWLLRDLVNCHRALIESKR